MHVFFRGFLFIIYKFIILFIIYKFSGMSEKLFK